MTAVERIPDLPTTRSHAIGMSAGYIDLAPVLTRRDETHALAETYARSAWSVDVGSVVDVEDGNGAGVVVDAVDDAVGAASGAVAAGQWSE